ncbi:MAG TPA: glycosyl hydrolase [Candidatus Eisenbacteria bacterium]|nr:glycosyl hydrolase [Candidatus Eisenbacteria bacterium]
MFRSALLAVLLLLPWAAFADAPKPPVTLNDRMAGMQFRCIGPYRGGRVTAVTGVRHQPLTFYMGATGGGVWKTTDGGSNWEVLSDKDFGTGSIGAIAVAESDPNVVYVGTGEAPIRGNLSAGDGVYRTVDGGRNWKNVGLKDAGQISRIRVDPHDPDVAYVAVQGHAWAPNATRGVYRTTDGGKTWKRVLFVDDHTGASDLSMDPNNPRILYAAFWQVIRRPWELVSGGTAGGLWRSFDGGDTWTKMKEGLPDSLVGKCGIAASGAKPGRVYAFVEAARGGVFRSEDYGNTWAWVNDSHGVRERAWYYAWLYPDPKDPDLLYIPSVDMWRSSDGGRSFGQMQVPHGDNHDWWIDPDDPNRMILGNDGGATITYNGGRTWSTQGNQPTAQFYRVITDQRDPYWVYGAQQDNSTVAIPSATSGGGIGAGDWRETGGGESGWIAPYPHVGDIAFAGGYGGYIGRYNARTREERDVTPWPQLASGRATSELKYRFQWNAPIVMSMHDSTTLWFASQVLHESHDEGQTWKVISPDLTRNDKAKQGFSGGPITRDITGVEVYGTIFALAESPVKPGVLWAGSDDGLVHVTKDGGAHWDNVTPRGLPTWIQINAIDASAHDPATAYVAATMYKFDDDRPYLYRTHDYGRSWTRIVDGLPADEFTRVVREDPARKGLLYAGTERGLYVSLDDGAHWTKFQRNLPHVPVADLCVHGSDLVVATQGRSFWILDDLTPLRGWDEPLARTDVKLFEPRVAERREGGQRFGREIRNEGQNAPNGVIVNYWLREAPGPHDTVTVEFLDGDRLLRRYSSAKPPRPADLKEQAMQEERGRNRDKPLEVKAGMNRLVWDMRILRPTLVPKAVFNDGLTIPPKVGAGDYTVRLRVGGHAYTTTAHVAPRPGSMATAQDLREQFELLAKLRDDLSQCHTDVLRIRDLKQQIMDTAGRAERLGHDGGVPARAKALTVKLDALEHELTNPDIQADEDDLNYPPRLDHEIAQLTAVVASADARPTAPSVEYYAIVKKQLEEVESRIKSLETGEIAEFNKTLDTEGIPRIAAAPKIEE